MVFKDVTIEICKEGFFVGIGDNKELILWKTAPSLPALLTDINPNTEGHSTHFESPSYPVRSMGEVFFLEYIAAQTQRKLIKLLKQDHRRAPQQSLITCSSHFFSSGKKSEAVGTPENISDEQIAVMDSNSDSMSNVDVQ